MPDKHFKVNLILIFILMPFFLRAQNRVIEITEDDSHLDLISRVEIFTENNKISSFQEIQNLIGFKANNKKIFLDYYNKENLWIKFSIKNSCKNDRRFILEIPNATINDLTFYKEEHSQNFKKIRTGASYNYNSREVKTRYFTFEIDIPPGNIRNYFINVNTEGDAMNFPLVLWKNLPYINKTATQRYFLGIYYGSILFIIIFHLFLFYKFRDKALIFYMLYVAGFAGYQLYMDGFASKYILPDYPFIAKRSLTMFAYLCFWSMIIFTQLYLNTAKIIPGFNKILNFFKWILLIGMLMCLINYQVYLVMQHILNFLGPLSTLMVIVGAIICSKYEPHLSKYLIIAFIFLILGILIEVTKNTGIVFDNSDYALKFGHASEAIILAFALAVRFKMNNEKAQDLALVRLKNLNQLKDQYNSELEKTVTKRTAELNISNKNLNDSILYARHIQHSLLPSRNVLEELIPEHFIFIKPKDIVSGDFYWYEKVEDKLIIAVVDCTGHGVPGALMSMLGSTLLRQIVKINKIVRPDKILQLMDLEIRSTLKQTHDDPFNKDGMDLSLISYDLNNRNVEFSGAKRPIVHFNSAKEMTIYKGSKFSIGGDLQPTDKSFCTEYIPLQRGDSIYLFTDGIIDQFGGEHDKKFMMTKFKNLLFEVQDIAMEFQGRAIEENIEKWQGSSEQVDDILVMGFKF